MPVLPSHVLRHQLKFLEDILDFTFVTIEVCIDFGRCLLELIGATIFDALLACVPFGCINTVTCGELNALAINRYEGEIQNIFKEFELREIMPLPEQVKEQFNARIAVARTEAPTQEAEPQRTFWDIYDEFTSEVGRKNDWTTATYEKFSALKNHLLKFKRGKISFETFTERGLNDLVDYFRYKCDMLNSTIWHKISLIKWI